MYIDGDYYEDVDYNLYSSVDENGKTDYRYCYIIERTEEFVKAILIIMMAFVVIRIAKDSEDTPFTHKNANRIRIIGALQFALSIAPGMVGFSMRFFRFTYANAQIKFDWVYMFAVSCVIMILAQVFDVGVKLQEENDLIA